MKNKITKLLANQYTTILGHIFFYEIVSTGLMTYQVNLINTETNKIYARESLFIKDLIEKKELDQKIKKVKNDLIKQVEGR